MDFSRVVVVLVRPQGPINVGAVARVCKNFGVAALRMVQPSADLQSMQARMFADDADDVLRAATLHSDVRAALHDVGFAIATSGVVREALQAPALTSSVARAFVPAPGARLALVFGPEDAGLTVDEARVCQRVLRLPTPGPYKSMNLSHAVAVALAAFCDDEADNVDADAGSAVDRDVVVDHWLQALQHAGYFSKAPAREQRVRLAALLDRAQPSDDDVRWLRDMFAVLARPRAMQNNVKP